MAYKKILFRRDTSANWTALNPILSIGEIGLNLTTNKIKLGDGATPWNILPYFYGSVEYSELGEHVDVTITDPTNGDFLRWNGTSWINDAVNLSTDTVGDYVASLVSGNGVTLTNNSGEAATPTLAVDTTVIQARVADVSDTEISYLNGVTSAIQTQLNNRPVAVPFTNKVYVDYLRADTYTATGTREYPYKTLATAYAAVPNTVSSLNPFTIVLLSGNTSATAENITFSKGHIFLTAENSSGPHAPIIFFGSLIFTGPNVTIGENHFAISDLKIVTTSATPAVTFSGSYPQQLFVKNVSIIANNASHGMTLTNTGSNSSVYVNQSQFAHYGSGHYHCINIEAGSAYLDSIETSGANISVIGVDGGICSLTNSDIYSGGDYAIDVYSAGSLTIKNCKVITTAADSHGIKLTSALSTAVVGNVYFNVPTSLTGKAIYGVSGSFLHYSNISYFPASNNQISSAITKTALADFGGPVSAEAAAAAYTDAAITALIDSAPGTLNTLNELAAAINDDDSYAATMTAALGLKSPSESPTFTGTVVLPGTTSIGDVSSLEISYLDGVSSSIQTQLGTKAPLESPTFTGTVTLPDNTVALGTKTTGNYMVDLTQGTGVSITHTPGEGSNATIAIGQSIGVSDSPTFVGLTINGSNIVLEGTTANDYETTISVTDPTADRIITIQDATGTVALTADITSAIDAVTTTVIEEGTNLYFTDERAQDAVGNILGTGFTYTDSTNGISVNQGQMASLVLDGVSGNSYGLVGTSVYLDVKDTNGYNKEIELDILAVESKLDTDGYLTTSSTSTLTNKTLTSPKINENVVLAATATELNILDGATLSTAELNILDGVTSSTAEINILDGVTSSTAELNILDGITSSTAELNILDGATVTFSELNILSGTTVSATELNYVDGVTSSIQTQIDTKAPINNPTFTGTVTLAGDPASALQAATKQYVDNVTAGLNFHQAVVVATTENLDGTYNNGSSGVGATLTKASVGALGNIDGIVVNAGERILLKSQTDQKENGIYVITVKGNGSTAWVLTRATDADTSTELKSGDFCFVTKGTLNGGFGFVNSTVSDPIVIGTTNVVYDIFLAAQVVVDGDGLLFNGNILHVGTASTSRIVVNTNTIDLATTGVSPNTYTSVTVDSYGRITSGSNLSPVITLAGDLSGSVTLTSLTSGTLTATIGPNSVALGTDTTGNYVSSLVAGTGITLSNNSGESATPTIAVTANTYDTYGSARNLEIKFLMEVM